MADPYSTSGVCECVLCRGFLPAAEVLPYGLSDIVAATSPADSPALSRDYFLSSIPWRVKRERLVSSDISRSVLEQRLPLPSQSAELLERIAQAKDPRTYSKGTSIAQPEWIPQSKDPTTYSRGTSIAQPERIPQAKDPTTDFKGASIARPEWIPQLKDLKTSFCDEWIPQAKDPTTNPKGTSIALPEWIPQAKDPTTCSRWPSVSQLASPNLKQVMRRDDVNDPPIGLPSSPAATRTQSIMSRISAFWHRHFQSREVQRNEESPMASSISPACSTTPCPSFSVVTVPSSQGHKSLSPVPSLPEVELHATPERSSEPSKWIPQEKDPTTHSEGIATTWLADPTVKQAVAFITESSHLSNEAFEVTPAVPYPSPGAMQEDLVWDLSGLVRRGQRTYRGQYSDVYKGTCGQQLVAIKVIKSLPCDPLHAVRRRMRREVGTASRFNHPNVLAVYGVIEADWCEFGGIVSLWCPNGDACSYLRSNPLTPSGRLLMVCGVAAGLEYIHSLSVVHGDLKPGNILIDASGNPLICDFGLVCILDAEQPDRAADNTTTVHNGTVRYLAYELAKDPPDSRTMASDIHALGCVAYEFLYLERPYSTRSGNSAELYIFRDIAAGISPAPRPPSPLSTSISALWCLLEWCWDMEPYRRPIISAFSHFLQPLTESDLQLDPSEILEQTLLL